MGRKKNNVLNQKIEKDKVKEENKETIIEFEEPTFELSPNEDIIKVELDEAIPELDEAKEPILELDEAKEPILELDEAKEPELESDEELELESDEELELGVENTKIVTEKIKQKLSVAEKRRLLRYGHNPK